jgi:cytoskeletal protein RodZ
MSIIHEALKKAALEKEGRQSLDNKDVANRHIPFESGRKKMRRNGRPLIIMLVVLMLISGIIAIGKMTVRLAFQNVPAVTQVVNISKSESRNNQKAQFAVEESPFVSSSNISAILESHLSFNQFTQIALRNAELYQGPTNGLINQNMKKAIETFQKNNRLEVNGIVGPETWAKLKVYLDKK